MAIFEKPRGTRDILPELSKIYYMIEKVCRDIFELYNYEEIKIPTFELSELFTKSIGFTTDIIEKEMYIFEDKKGRKLALRPEGTAGIVRAYIENNFRSKSNITKLFYYAQMFRYERPQANRYREFYQIGAEYFGDNTYISDFEIISMCFDILNRLNVDFKLFINSLGCKNCRGLFREKFLEKLEFKKNSLCNNCKIRAQKNPLRILDCKIDVEKFVDFPHIVDFLCVDCKKNFEELLNLLEKNNLKYEIDHFLVRGLDYYTRTIFEIKLNGIDSKESTIIGGGRYDDLVEILGGVPTPACGFAIGIDRLASQINVKNILTKKKLFIATSGNEEVIKEYAIKVSVYLRKNNFITIGPVGDKSLKSQMRLADSMKTDFVIIVGEEELKNDLLTVRNMKEQTQEKVPFNTIVKYFS